MRNSLHGRISVAIAIIIIGMAAAMSYTVQKEVGSSLNSQLKYSSQNILDAICAEVENEFQSIIFSREELYSRRKIELQNLMTLAISIINSKYHLAQQNLITTQQAQQQSIAMLRNLRFDRKTGYFWIYEGDDQATMLMHGAMPELENKPVPAFGIDPATGMYIADSFTRICRTHGEGFLEYRWPKPNSDRKAKFAPKLTFVKIFAPWNWIIGTGMYIDDIEAVIEERRKAVISELQQTISSLKIGDNGYAFIFSEDGQIFVHPIHDTVTPGSDGKLTLEEKNFIRQIIQRRHEGFNWMDYQWIKPGTAPDKRFVKRVYFRYFAPLDFYICLSSYNDELNTPIKHLIQNLSWLLLLILPIAAGGTFWLARTLSAPLRKLAVAAEDIARNGMDNAVIPVSGSIETRELGEVLSQVIDTIRQKETSLRTSEENSRIILSSIGDAVIATDINGKIIRMNPTAEKITDWTFQEACGHELLDGIQLSDSVSGNSVPCPINTVLASGKPYNLPPRTVLISRAGVRKLIDDSCAPIFNLKNELIGCVIAFRDVSAQSEMELQLLNSQKMDSLGLLAGGVAHDFNNMLAGMMSSAEMLKHKISTQQSKIHEYADMIISTCQRAASLTNKLLAFSRKGKIVSSPIDVHSTVADAIVILSRSVDKRVSITFDPIAECPIIMGDPSLLQNIIINLCINAAHAMPNGGKLQITTGNISLDQHDCLKYREFGLTPGKYLELAVRDEGSGISPELLPHIFEPFFTTRQESSNRGLGLAAIYGSVKEHHGAIRVWSRIGQGSIFTIILPICTEIVIDTPVALTVPPAHLHGTVLLVDDESIIRAAAGAMLEDAGIKTVQASGGREALCIFRKNPQMFDAVVLDMVMPEINGEECFYAMKNVDPEARIVLMSGFANDEKFSRMKADGLVAMLKKPFRQQDLLEAITLCLKEEKFKEPE